MMLTDEMYRQPKMAGFSPSQISNHRQKFFNLFNRLPAPMPARIIEECPKCNYKRWSNE